ncbi:MAG: hypothetical protein ABFS17_13985 [Chloroflexota bacterium]
MLENNQNSDLRIKLKKIFGVFRKIIFGIFNVVIVAVVSLLFLWYLDTRGIQYRAPGELSPWKIFDKLDAAGYVVSSVEENDSPTGWSSQLGYNITFDIQEKDQIYTVRVIECKSFREAKKEAKYTNKIDRQVGGNLAYAFPFGNLLVEFWPSDEEFGRKLLDFLIESE